MKWFKKPPVAGPTPEPPRCLHEHWRIYGSTSIGCVTCLDCGREIFLSSDLLKRAITPDTQEEE